MNPIQAARAAGQQIWLDNLSRALISSGELARFIEMGVAGWIAFVEELLVRWLDEPVITRDQLVDIFVTALPALAGVVGMVTAGE